MITIPSRKSYNWQHPSDAQVMGAASNGQRSLVARVNGSKLWGWFHVTLFGLMHTWVKIWYTFYIYHIPHTGMYSVRNKSTQPSRNNKNRVSFGVAKQKSIPSDFYFLPRPLAQKPILSFSLTLGSLPLARQGSYHPQRVCSVCL